MTALELLKMRTERARMFRQDRDHYRRNAHMHDITAAPPREVVDAVLAGFLNEVGRSQGIDYAFGARDFDEGTPNSVPTTPINYQCPKISVERSTKKIAYFDGFDCVRDFYPYQKEDEAIQEAVSWFTFRSTSAPEIIYPGIRKMRAS